MWSHYSLKKYSQFSMNKVLFATSLLFMSIVLPTFGDTLYYKLAYQKDFYLKSSNITVIKKLSSIIYLTPSSEIDNGFEAGTFDLEVGLYHADESVIWHSSNPCKSIAKIVEDIARPFVIVLDDNQSFKSVKVQEDEAELTKNEKLFISSIMTVNALKLNEEENSSPVAETTSYGQCNVKYNVVSSDGEATSQNNFLVNKKTDTKTCTRDMINYTSADQNLLTSRCKSEEENNLQWLIDSELKVLKQSTDYIITETIFNETLKFSTLNNSDEELYWDVKLQIEPLNQSDLPKNFTTKKYNDDNTIELSKTTYKPVNEAILLETNPKVDTDIQVMYRSLVCEPAILILEYDTFEGAISCLSE